MRCQTVWGQISVAVVKLFEPCFMNKNVNNNGTN